MARSPVKKKQKTHKWLNLSQKLEIIDMRENGASFAKIAHDKEMPESTVRGICAKKDEYRSQGKV